MKKKKTKSKKRISSEVEKEIFAAYNAGMKRSKIKHFYKIDDNQFKNNNKGK